MRRERPTFCPGKRPFLWPRQVAEGMGIDLRAGKRIHCPRCGRHVTSLVLETDGKWSCRPSMIWGTKSFRGCYRGRVTPYEGLAAEYAFGLFIGLRTKVMRERRAALAGMVARMAGAARTPRDLLVLAEASTLLEVPLRIAYSRRRPSYLPPRKNEWSPFWLAVRPYFVDAYVDSLLHPASFAMVVGRPVLEAQGITR